MLSPTAENGLVKPLVEGGYQQPPLACRALTTFTPQMDVAPLARPLKLPFMDGGPDIVDETTRAASPRAGRRDAWLEQRLHFLIGEQVRLKGGVPFRRLLRGAAAAYRRFLFTADPAHRFHAWATIHAVSAGLDQLEHRGDRLEVAGSVPDGPDPGQALAAGLADQPH